MNNFMCITIFLAALNSFAIETQKVSSLPSQLGSTKSQMRSSQGSITVQAIKAKLFDRGNYDDDSRYFRRGGGQDGNGGDVVVCRERKGKVVSIELLDYYEARVERQMELKLGNPNSVEEGLVGLFERMSFHDSVFSELMKDWAQNFNSEAKFLPNVELVDIPDSKHLTFPSGCKVEQIAIQKIPKLKGDKFYTINKDLWDRLDNANKAGLVMHEILYRNLTIRGGGGDSTYVRYFNSLLGSDTIKSMNKKEYLDFVYRYFGVRYAWVSDLFIEGGIFDTATAKYNERQEIIEAKISYLEPTEVVAGQIRLQMETDKSLIYSVDQVKCQFSLSGAQTSEKTFQYQGFQFYDASYYLKLTFDYNKNLLEVDSDTTTQFKEGYQNKIVPIKCKKLNFDPKRTDVLICSNEAIRTTYDQNLSQNYILPFAPQRSSTSEYPLSKLEIGKNLMLRGALSPIGDIFIFDNSGKLTELQCIQSSNYNSNYYGNFEKIQKFYLPNSNYSPAKVIQSLNFFCNGKPGKYLFNSDGNMTQGNVRTASLSREDAGDPYHVTSTQMVTFGQNQIRCSDGVVNVKEFGFETYRNGQVKTILIPPINTYEIIYHDEQFIASLQFDESKVRPRKIHSGDKISLDEQGRIIEIHNLCLE